MRNIEKKYQQLIKDMEHVYDNAYDTFRNQIEDLESVIQNKNEEIEELRGGNKLQKEIDEYNRFEAQHNMNLEEEIERLKAENSRLKKAYSDLEKAYELTVDTPAPAKKTGRRAGRKNKAVVAYCKDCGTYFQAGNRAAKYCGKCKLARAKASRAKWLAKQK